MFFLKKRKTELKKPDYSLLKADMHSHLLPGIDDGSPDLETSINLIRGMQELGFKKLITTPHILWDIYKNTNAIILEKLEVVKNQLREERIDIQLEAAAEYFIDDHLAELLEKKKPLLTFGNRMVLVEFSMVSQPYELKKILFEMQMQGYQPVLAHPERYVYFERNKNIYDELKSAGYLFQLNALSLSGHYGNSVMKLARYLATNQYYDLIGTDLHHFSHLDALKNPSQSSILQQIFESEKILNREL
jgi:tyrosine-protein phosphatase YwqE